MKTLTGRKAPEFHAPAVINGNEIVFGFSKYGEVCPANRSKGKNALQATNEGVSGYLSQH